MTDAEWKKEQSRLKGAITRARRKVFDSRENLKEKLALVKLRKEAEENLRQHRLHYHTLVNNLQSIATCKAPHDNHN